MNKLLILYLGFIIFFVYNFALSIKYILTKLTKYLFKLIGICQIIILNFIVIRGTKLTIYHNGQRFL